MHLPEHIKNVFRTATCLYDRAKVEAALDQMAIKMNAVLANTNPIFLCVVVGGLIPLGNLLPRLDFPLEVDYSHLTRYTGETRGNKLVWITKPQKKMENRTVVVVDDILDVGITLKAIVDYCYTQYANKVYSAVLVDKQGSRDKQGLQTADFTGLEVPNRYVFGYGMDYKEYLRNAPGIYAVAPEFE